MKRKPLPRYLIHSQSGRGRAVWMDRNGRRQERMLPGFYDSEESRAAFAPLLLEVESSPHQETTAVTLAHVLLAFVEWAEGHYRHPDGKPTSELCIVKLVAVAVDELYGSCPIAKFGPLAVKAMRQRWVNNGRTRKECNRRVGIIKRILKWAVSEELAPANTYQAVATVAGLQRGRSEAKELEPVGPVADDVVDATLPYLNRHVRGLIELQRLTGCRPGEVCSIRRSEIDTGGPVWLYKPTLHKNSWRGKARTIAIGPKAQALLKGFFTLNLDDYLFSPRLALQELNEDGRPIPLNGERRPKERYDRTSYARSIARACEQMNPLPQHLDRRVYPKKEGDRRRIESRKEWWKRLTAAEKSEVKAWREAHRWHPNQLRHTFATKSRKLFSLEHAGAALGHTKMSATEIYAERDDGLAVEVATKIG